MTVSSSRQSAGGLEEVSCPIVTRRGHVSRTQGQPPGAESCFWPTVSKKISISDIWLRTSEGARGSRSSNEMAAPADTLIMA